MSKIEKELIDLDKMASFVRIDQDKIKERMKNLKYECSTLIHNIDSLLLETGGSWIQK